MQGQSSSGNNNAAVPAAVVSWEYLDMTWITYDHATQRQIEDAYLQYTNGTLSHGKCDLTHGSFFAGQPNTYEVIFMTMEQRNKSTNNRRAVRRLIRPSTSANLTHEMWELTDNHQYQYEDKGNWFNFDPWANLQLYHTPTNVVILNSGDYEFLFPRHRVDKAHGTQFTTFSSEQRRIRLVRMQIPSPQADDVPTAALKGLGLGATGAAGAPTTASTTATGIAATAASAPPDIEEADSGGGGGRVREILSKDPRSACPTWRAQTTHILKSLAEIPFDPVSQATLDACHQGDQCCICLEFFSEAGASHREPCPGDPTDGSEMDTTDLNDEEYYSSVSSHPEIVLRFPCSHLFHGNCVLPGIKNQSFRCYVCSAVHGKPLTGNQPPGEMRVHLSQQPLPGFDSVGHYIIDYEFPPGLQGPEHPTPGAYFNGDRRRAYLPATDKGLETLKRLKTAFERRLTFTIGLSLTLGPRAGERIIWNGIHHKTSLSGGAFGFPDPTYFERVDEELRAFGI